MFVIYQNEIAFARLSGHAMSKDEVQISMKCDY
jgi:hypothetical protein